MFFFLDVGSPKSNLTIQGAVSLGTLGRFRSVINFIFVEAITFEVRDNDNVLDLVMLDVAGPLRIQFFETSIECCFVKFLIWDHRFHYLRDELH